MVAIGVCVFGVATLIATLFYFRRTTMSNSFNLLNQAKEYLLQGNYSVAASYFSRARSEGNIPEAIVDFRYLTKNHLVYPIEYENSTAYFELIKKIKIAADSNPEYANEYKMALSSLSDIKRMFLRAVSLFYYTDIEVCEWGSVVLKEILNLYHYLDKNKKTLVDNNIYGWNQYLPKIDLKQVETDLAKVELFCLNILVTYTAVQSTTYKGKEYSAYTIDYGSFICTDVVSRDVYTSFAFIKCRLSVLGYAEYYHDYCRDFQKKSSAVPGFNCSDELQQEITALLKRKAHRSANEKEFIIYAKQFEKQTGASESYLTIMTKFNPLLKLYLKIPFLDKKRCCSFDIGNVFHRKMWFGVCDMISAGNRWSIDTVRWGMIGLSCFAIGVFIYFGLAIAMKLGCYWGVNVERL